MKIFKLRTKLVAVTVLVLSGCASTYWQQDLAWVNFKPTQISVVERDDPSQLCGSAPGSLWGCAIRQREMNHCFVVIKANLPYEAYSCTTSHEVRHCLGEQHTSTGSYAVDCGNGEFYLPPVQASR